MGVMRPELVMKSIVPVVMAGVLGLSAGMAIGIVGDAGVRDKKWGGLGLRDLKMHNKSLLFKWLWKYSSEDEAFWKQIIEAVHGVKGGMETMFSYSHTKRVGLEEHNQVMG
ncbi:uncharacterized protein [Nicotiana tomentosiformis]|uniref:uncharacterized protein isoform X2 n=1 Tax=Nicotiana tomentosiformis TaxID=4098 RepID=UPI00388C71BD